MNFSLSFICGYNIMFSNVLLWNSVYEGMSAMYKEMNKELEDLQQKVYRCRNIDSKLKNLYEQLSEQEKSKKI